MLDDEILIQKIKESSKIKYILPLKNNETQEEELIEDFLIMPHANPNRYTVAMEGKPFSMLVVMNNGLRYRATMTRLVNLDWNEVLNAQKKLEQSPSQGNLELKSQILTNQPIVDLNSFTNAVLLHPLHNMAQTERNDSLDVRWGPDIDILTAKPTDIMGTAVGRRSFRGLNTWGGFFIHYPTHMRKLFKSIQNEYEKFRRLGILGHAIYTIFDPTRPPRGTMRPLGKSDREFGIRAIQYINPNRPQRVMGHKNTPFLKLPLHEKEKQD